MSSFGSDRLETPGYHFTGSDFELEIGYSCCLGSDMPRIFLSLSFGQTVDQEDYDGGPIGATTKDFDDQYGL